MTDGEVVMQLGHRHWRAWGLRRNTSFDTLRVSILVSREGGVFHVDTLDLYSARGRAVFTTQAAVERGGRVSCSCSVGGDGSVVCL